MRIATYKQVRAALEAELIERLRARSMDAAAVKRYYNTAIVEFETIGRREVIYADYERAMLQPGLSIEQRRLLFSAALARMAQPLPPGSRMPNHEMLPRAAL